MFFPKPVMFLFLSSLVFGLQACGHTVTIFLKDIVLNVYKRRHLAAVHTDLSNACGADVMCMSRLHHLLLIQTHRQLEVWNGLLYFSLKVKQYVIE